MATLDALRQRLRGRYQTGYARAGAALEQRIVTDSPVDTGNMQQNSRVFPRGPLALEVVIAAEYASYVRGGTRPHVIAARPPRSALRFEIDGQVFYRRQVNHPGTQPNDWYDRALADFPAMVEAELRSLP